MKANRTLSHWWQRRTRGWDDSETWDLDVSLAKLIAPRLRRFREVSTGTPISYFEFVGGKQITPDATANKAWMNDLAKMIVAFEFWEDGRWAETTVLQVPDVVLEGLQLFAKHFQELGW